MTIRPHRNVTSRARSFKNERVHSTPSVGRKGGQFCRIFLYKSFAFYRLMSINRIMQSQELDFLQMTVLSDRQVPLAVWVAQPAKTNKKKNKKKKKNVGSDLTVGPDASEVLALIRKNNVSHFRNNLFTWVTLPVLGMPVATWIRTLLYIRAKSVEIYTLCQVNPNRLNGRYDNAR